MIINPVVFSRVSQGQVHPEGHHTPLVHNELEVQEPPGGVLPLQAVLHQTLAPLMVGEEVVPAPTTVEQGEGLMMTVEQDEGLTTNDNHRGTETTTGNKEPEVEATDALLVMEDVDPQELVEEEEVQMTLVVLVEMEVMEMITNPPKLGQPTQMLMTSLKDNDGCLSSTCECSGKLSKRIE